MKKIFYCSALLLFSVYACTAFGWVEWNYTGASHSWNNAANWGGAVPTSLSDPIMRGQGVGNEAFIDSDVNAVGNLMWV
ncbi:MAG: hypothetical protein ABFD79_11750, partial [Phycisphaerales bacterium]